MFNMYNMAGRLVVSQFQNGIVPQPVDSDSSFDEEDPFCSFCSLEFTKAEIMGNVKKLSERLQQNDPTLRANIRFVLLLFCLFHSASEWYSFALVSMHAHLCSPSDLDRIGDKGARILSQGLRDNKTLAAL